MFSIHTSGEVNPWHSNGLQSGNQKSQGRHRVAWFCLRRFFKFILGLTKSSFTNYFFFLGFLSRSKIAFVPSLKNFRAKIAVCLPVATNSVPAHFAFNF